MNDESQIRRDERERIAQAIEDQGSDATYWEATALNRADRDLWAAEAKAFRIAARIARNEGDPA